MPFHVNGEDVWSMRLVLTFLGLTVLLSGAGITVLTIRGMPVPGAIAGFGGTALGCLVSLMMSHTRRGAHDRMPPDASK